jgi:hypothetical protein
MGLQPTSRERETGGCDPFEIVASTDPAALNEHVAVVSEHGAGRGVRIEHRDGDQDFDAMADSLRRPDVIVTDTASPGVRGYRMTSDERARLEAEAERRGVDLIALLRGEVQ